MLIDLAAAALTYAVVALAAWPLGLHIARVHQGRPTFLHPLLRPAERSIYWLTGVREGDEQTWTRYLLGVLSLGAVGTLLGYVQLRLQGHLPLDTQGRPGVAPDLSLNTAVSYAANTGWENYAGEQTLSYLSQMLVIVPNMFLSMAAGMAVAVAVIRGFVRRETSTLGNVYVDVTRSVVYVLLTLSVVGALFLVSQGVIQNVNPYRAVRTLEGATQVIAQGPVASQEVIKDMSGAGGGFFNASSAHPFENPNGLTHQFEIFLQLIVPFAMAITLGRMVGRPREGLVLAAVMWAILLVATAVASNQEQAGNRALSSAGADQAWTAQQAGGNMEGKEVRFGPILTGQFFAAATGSGDGDVDAGYDSLMPLTTLVGLAQMKVGEVTPGGPGSGLYGLLLSPSRPSSWPA